MQARRMCSIRAAVVGGSLSTPWSVFSWLNRYHLNSLAREILILFDQESTQTFLASVNDFW